MTTPDWLYTPGLHAAARAVADLTDMVVGMGEVGPTVEQVITTTMAASRPHVQAELLADLSDEFAEVAPTFAEMLDQISYDMRKAVTR